MKAIRRQVQLPAIRLVCSALAFVAAGATAGGQSALAAAAEGRNSPSGSVVISVRPGTKVAVVERNEVGGVSKTLLKLSDQIAEIPLKGEKESLNVSVAAGVFLFRLLKLSNLDVMLLPLGFV